MNRELISQVRSIAEGDILPQLLDEIKQEYALSIVRTSIDQKDKREELYMLTKAIDALKAKLQEYVNEYSKDQESE